MTLVDVTLRIDEKNLASLLAERHPASAVWMERNEDGTYALCARVPIGFEVSRGLPNHDPDAEIERLSAEEKAELGRRWDEKHGARP